VAIEGKSGGEKSKKIGRLARKDTGVRRVEIVVLSAIMGSSAVEKVIVKKLFEKITAASTV